MGVGGESERSRFSGFLGREWGRLVHYVRSWIADSADRDAEDIVQDVAEGLFERADLTEPIADLSAYVYRALRNRVIDAYRAPRRTVSLDEQEPPLGGELQGVLADLRYEASAEAEKKAASEELFAAIDALPAEQRAVVVATELEGWKFRELSDEWDVPVGTLLARKHRAMRTLRAALTAQREGRRSQ